MNADKKVMLFGSTGFLGRHLRETLESRGFSLVCCNHAGVDITDGIAVQKAVSGYAPDIVVNCAAISSTGYAKDHPDESMVVNVIGPENIARACLSSGALFYTMSSDQVYGGCDIDGPLPEDLVLSPNNTYGQHKLLMEQRVLSILPSSVILRLTWMFEPYNPRNPHIDMAYRLAMAKERNEDIKASTRELRGITCVDTVCDRIVRSFGNLPGAVYNFGSGNLLDSYHTLLHVAAAAGLPRERIVPDNSWGRNLSMDCSKVGRYGVNFPDTVDSLTASLLPE